MASGSAEISDNDSQTLSSIFQEGLDLYNNIVNSQAPTNSPEVQLNIKSAMRKFEQSTRLVSMSDLFSTNEGIEEIATNDLQYLLLPSLLGSLSLKLTSGERKDIVDAAEIYFRDFLKRCNEYGLCKFNAEGKESKNEEENLEQREITEFEKLEAAVNSRAHKIQRFKEQKELKQKLGELKNNVENEHVDEEIKRTYFLTMIRLAILDAIDELNSIKMEKPILEHMAKTKDDKPQRRQPPPPLKPIIITRDEVQKAVYGAGYPSLPTMTVQEFYDKRVADGVFPDPNKKQEGPLSLQQASLAGLPVNDEDKEDEEKEKMVEEDDEEYIQRMRNMDEYKDTHRRGWGNRMNRS